ncbi:96_t:CDS:2, partial [Acaulospora colombiana]
SLQTNPCSEMVSITKLILAATSIVGTVAVAVPTGVIERYMEDSGLLQARAPATITIGDPIGFPYYWWTDGTGSANFTNGPGGQFSVTWSGGHFIGGKGWNPGSSSRTINYSG